MKEVFLFEHIESDDDLLKKETMFLFLFERAGVRSD